MGINAIGCKGQYAGVKASGFGKKYTASSDFDGEDLKGLATLGLVTVVGAALWYALDDNMWWPADGTEPAPARLHGRYTEIAFRHSGQMETVESPVANKSYQIEFRGANQGLIDTAKFDVRNLNTSETRTVTFYQGNSIQIDEAIRASMEIDGKYVKLTLGLSQK